MMESEQSMTTSEWQKHLGMEVRRLRVARGITQDELAQRANISISTIRYLEAGKGSSLASLIRVAKVLDRTSWLASFAPPTPSISPIEMLRERTRTTGAERSRVRPKSNPK